MLLEAISRSKSRQPNEYAARLQSETDQFTEYIRLADAALGDAPPAKFSSPIIPYIPGKESPLDSTVASRLLRDNLARHESFVAFSKHRKRHEPILEEAVRDFRDILHVLNQQVEIRSRATKFSPPQIISLKASLVESLEYVVQRYLELNGLEPDVESSVQLLLSLMEASSGSDPWVKVSSHEQFVKTLIMRNVIIARSDSTRDEYYLRMRDLL